MTTDHPQADLEMDPDRDHAPEPEEPAKLHPFRRLFGEIIDAAKTLIQRIKAAREHGSNPYLPRRFARALAKAPDRTEARIESAYDWVCALAAVLAGNTHYLMPFRRGLARLKGEKRLSRATRAEARLKPWPPSTEKQRDAARLRYKRLTFLKVPTNKIAKRLARRLGIREDSDAWPHELLAITEPPAVWADRTYRNGKRTAPPQTINWYKLAKSKPKPAPTPESVGIEPVPAFHRRE